MEELTKAEHGLAMAVDDLQAANAKAGPVAAIVLLGLLTDAVSLRDRVNLLRRSVWAQRIGSSREAMRKRSNKYPVAGEEGEVGLLSG